MYVTKYSELYDEEAEDMGERGDAVVHRRYIYAVSCLDDLVRISRALEARGYSGRSEVYISEMEEEYYLVLTDDRADTSIVCEYAEPVSFSAMPAYLSEHARLLCEREAVSSFSRLF